MAAPFSEVPTTPWEAPRCTVAFTSDNCIASAPAAQETAPPLSSSKLSSLVSLLNSSQESSDSGIHISENVQSASSGQDFSPCGSSALSSTHANNSQVLLEQILQERCQEQTLPQALPAFKHACTEISAPTEHQPPASSLLPCSDGMHSSAPQHVSDEQQASLQLCGAPIQPALPWGHQSTPQSTQQSRALAAFLQRVSHPMAHLQDAARANHTSADIGEHNVRVCTIQGHTATATGAYQPTNVGSAPLPSPQQQIAMVQAIPANAARSTQRAVGGILKKVSGVGAHRGARQTKKRVRFMHAECDDSEEEVDQHRREAGAAYALWSMTRAV